MVSNAKQKEMIDMNKFEKSANKIIANVKKDKIRKIDLIDLGFKRTDVSAEESGYIAFYYYDMDFGNKKAISLISPSNDEVVDDEWYVEIFEDESLRIDKLNNLIDFINIMKSINK